MKTVPSTSRLSDAVDSLFSRQQTPSRLLVVVAAIVGISASTFVHAQESKTVQATPQPQAHAHNDYHHERPLFDALSHGFCSVEADVFAIDGELRVGHDRSETKPGRTLEKLYLDPLRQLVKKNDGRVYKNGPLFTLLIDFKTRGEPTYALLQPLLAKYKDMLVSTNDNEAPAISIVISGNRPFELIKSDKSRLCGIDGRLSDLDSDMSPALMPLISDNWRSHFKWRGDGDIPAAEKAKLADAVTRAHQAGRRLRFWATPENENFWKVLADAGVDHINTDQLAQLERFLKMNKPSSD